VISIKRSTNLYENHKSVTEGGSQAAGYDTRSYLALLLVDEFVVMMKRNMDNLWRIQSRGKGATSDWRSNDQLTTV
jgi:hypothetical protein